MSIKKINDQVNKQHQSSLGFTLLEIVIALAIVAISVLAIAGAMNKHTEIASGLEQRILASWVASNTIAELRHNAKINRVRVGNSSDTIKMGGHRWRARTVIERTDVERVYKVTVTVKDDAQRDEAAFSELVTAISDDL